MSVIISPERSEVKAKEKPVEKVETPKKPTRNRKKAE